MTRAARVLSSLASLALLIGCGTESDRSIAGTLVASHTASFSAWSDPVNLGPVVNSSSDDQGAFVSKDGLVLYFVSTRAGGFGGQDIYVTHRATVDDPWGSPQNMGPTINKQQ
jgi:hypothetical protein